MHQKRERQNARLREQLMAFYAPLYSLRVDILAKSELRERLHAVAGSNWKRILEGVTDAEQKNRLLGLEWASHEKVISYSEDQVRTDLIPKYRQLLEIFRAQNGGNIRFLMGRSRRLRSRSALEVMLTLNINLVRGA